MKIMLAASVFALSLAASVHAEATFPLKTTVFGTNGTIKPSYAACVKPVIKYSPRTVGDYIGNGENKSMGVSWKDAPAGTKSFALVMYDMDGLLPASFGDMNQLGKTIPDNAPRSISYGWVVANIPASSTGLPEGIDKTNHTLDVLPDAQADFGLLGLNNISTADPKNVAHKSMMLGYRGPCPAFNDVRVHHYYIKVFALDVEKLDLKKDFTGFDLEQAAKDHTLAIGTTHGNYSTNQAYNPEKNSTPVASKPR